MIRIQHRSVSSGILLAASPHYLHSFDEEPEHEMMFSGLSITFLFHRTAKTFQRIYLDIFGCIPDSDE